MMHERVKRAAASTAGALTVPGSFAPARGALIEDRALDLSGVAGAVRRRLRSCAVTFITVGGAVILLASQLTPRYAGEASLMIDQRQQQIIDLQSVLSGLPTDSAVVDTEVEIIRSLELARRVSAKLDLVSDPEFNPALRNTSLAEEVSATIKAAIRRVLNDNGREGGLPAAAPASEITAAMVQRRLSVRRQALTYMINIEFESENPEKAALIANTYVDSYIERQLETKFDATQRANDWLSERLEGLRVEVEDAEATVESFRAANGLVNAEGAPVIEARIADLNSQLTILRADLAESSARAQTVADAIANGEGAEAVSEVLDSEVMRELRRQQAEVVRRRAELLSELGPLHPQIVQVENELLDLETEIESEVQRIVGSFRNEAFVARSRIASLESSLADAEQEANSQNQSLVRLRELQRTAEANRVLYESFLNRFRQTTEQLGIEQADASIVSPASTPSAPSFPKLSMLAALGLALGAVAGVAVVVFLEMVDSGCRSLDDIEEVGGGGAIGVIPRLTAKTSRIERSAMDPIEYVVARPFSEFAEAFRLLKASLFLTTGGRLAKVVLITSGLSGEGKTTCTACFGRTLALSGLRILMVDADLRHRNLSKKLCPGAEIGLIEVLTGDAPIGRAIVSDSSGADILPVSNVVFTTKDIFGTDGFQELLGRLKENYDAIIVDSAPVLAVADTLSLSQRADSVIALVRFKKTSRHVVRSVANELRKMIGEAPAYVMTQAESSGGRNKRDPYARYYQN